MRNPIKIATALAVSLTALSCSYALQPIPAFAQDAVMAEQDLHDMITAAEKGSTVALTGNVELSNTLKINGKTITLDLSGYSISLKDSSKSFAIDVNWMSNVEIKNGSIFSACGGIKYAGPTGLTLKSCTVETSNANAAAIELQSGEETANSVFESSTIRNTAGGKAVAKTFQDKSNLSFTGNCAIAGDISVVCNASSPMFTVTINGGRYSGSFVNPNTAGGVTELAKRLGIVSGLFAVEPSKDYLDPNSLCISSAEPGYPFEVTQSTETGVAYIEAEDGSRKYYETLSAALTASNGKAIALARTASLDNVAELKGATIKGANGLSLLCQTATVEELVSTGVLLDGVTIVCSDATVTAATSDANGLIGGALAKDTYGAVANVLADGYLVASESYAIHPVANFEAMIGVLGYQAVSSAVNAATSGDSQSVANEEIVLLRDVIKDSSDGILVNFPKSTFTLNLNGFTLGTTAKKDGVSHGGILIVPLTMPSGTLYEPNNTHITVKNGTIVGTDFGIGTNGTVSNVKIDLENVNISADKNDGVAMYLPASGQTNIKGGEISGALGVQTCSSGLTIDGASIAVYGDPQKKTGGDGPIMDGSAVSIVKRAGYQDLALVEIKGGTFKSEGNDAQAVSAYGFEKGEVTEWADAGEVVSISGGSFNTVVPEGLIDPDSDLVQNEDGSFTVCTHVGVRVEAKPATCTEDGNTEHWSCSECGKLFEDEGLTKEIAAKDVVVKAAGHDVENAVHHEGKAATVDAEGVVEHWECPACHALFLDEGLTKPATADDVVLPKLDPEPNPDPEPEPTPDPEPEPGEDEKPGPKPEVKPGEDTAAKGDTLPTTGDNTMLPIAMAGIAGAAAVAAGVAVSVKRREQQ